MKKVISIITSAVMCISCLGFMPKAFPKVNFHVSATITDSGKCGDNLTWMFDDGVLTISGSGDMYDYNVNYHPAPWLVSQITITYVIIEEGVTSIGDSAFNRCNSLISVTIPDSVTSIGEVAFYECRNLTSVTIPNSVASIGDRAFYECRKLISVTIPDSVTSIGDGAFYECRKLTSVTMGNSVTSIGKEAFSETPWLDVKRAENPLVIVNNILVDGKTATGDVVIPYGVTSIGEYAFRECTNLTSVTIPDSVTSIEYYAFSYCENLTSVKIPDSVTSIGRAAFSETPWLDIKRAENPLVIVNNILVDGKTATGDVVIPYGVTSIGDEAFYECKNLTSVKIPDSVTSIGSSAFSGTPWLEAKRAENPLVIVNNILIDGKTATGDVVIPYGVRSIGKCAFIESGLTSVTIPDSVTSIGDEALYCCRNLTSVTIKNPNCKIYDYKSTISYTATIYGYSGSTAEDYAKEHYIKFVSIDKVVTITATTITTTTTTLEQVTTTTTTTLEHTTTTTIPEQTTTTTTTIPEQTTTTTTTIPEQTTTTTTTAPEQTTATTITTSEQITTTTTNSISVSNTTISSTETHLTDEPA